MKSQLTDQCVDTAELLEDLNTASNQETTLTLDAIVPEQVRPRTSTDRCLESNGVNDIAVHGLDVLIAGLAAPQTLQNKKTLIVAVVACQPSRRLWHDKDQGNHRNEEDALQDGWDTPDKAGRGAL